jgi:hypothetical protein
MSDRNTSPRTPSSDVFELDSSLAKNTRSRKRTAVSLAPVLQSPTENFEHRKPRPQILMSGTRRDNVYIASLHCLIRGLTGPFSSSQESMEFCRL